MTTVAPVSLGDFGQSAKSSTSEEMSFYSAANALEYLAPRDWEERCVLLREGQIQLDLARRVPPLEDATLKDFAEWLDLRKLPILLAGYPQFLRTGVSIDISDNRVTSEGLSALLDVLMRHNLPVTAVKAWRNLLDDGIVDSLVLYFHTQPATMPLLGLHLSHNRITTKGALRLVRAIIECGQYPTRMTRKPFWLRLELNELERPEDVVQTCRLFRGKLREGVKHTLCLMQKGLCASNQCDHESVAIHAPYFLSQNRRGYFDDRDRALLETAAFTSYDPMAIASSSSSTRYFEQPQQFRQNLTKNAGPQGAYSSQLARPAPAMQFLEVSLDDVCGTLGFSLTFSAAVQYPTVKTVDPSGEAGRCGLKSGMVLKRANGVDVSLLTQTQVQEVLKQRPLSLRFTFQ
jgi:hypothetical protein